MRPGQPLGLAHGEHVVLIAPDDFHGNVEPGQFRDRELALHARGNQPLQDRAERRKRGRVGALAHEPLHCLGRDRAPPAEERTSRQRAISTSPDACE